MNDELTDAGVAIVAEVVALPAVALEHVVVDVEAHLVVNIIKLFRGQRSSLFFRTVSDGHRFERI